MAKRILVVDDEPRVLAVLKKRLESVGYQVTTASDGIEGLARAKSEKPDLVVLDLMLPKKDGFEVCWELQHDPVCHQIPILVLSARSQDGDIQRGIASGASAYMMKPFDTDLLLERIAGLLDKADEEAAIRKGQEEASRPPSDQ